MAKPEFNAVVSERVDYGPESCVLRVVPKGWSFHSFKPGQYTTLGLPGKAPRCEGAKPDAKPPKVDQFCLRAYSIASSPLNRGYVEFYIVLVKEGLLTPRLWCLKVGDPIWLSPKVTGHFVMDDVPPDKNIVFVATGTGIAPYISMLTTHMNAGDKRKMALFHGVRVSQDLGYRSECFAMERLCPNFSYHPIISRPHLDPVPWSGATGHVKKLWEASAPEKTWGFKPTPDNTRLFLCGSPQMIDGMIALLGKDGFTEHKPREPGTIHVERYL